MPHDGGWWGGRRVRIANTSLPRVETQSLSSSSSSSSKSWNLARSHWKITCTPHAVPEAMVAMGGQPYLLPCILLAIDSSPLLHSGIDRRAMVLGTVAKVLCMYCTAVHDPTAYAYLHAEGRSRYDADESVASPGSSGSLGMMLVMERRTHQAIGGPGATIQASRRCLGAAQ
nr:hypothetical protein CFP56_13313 [Quercus suber]